ncbi:IclR family transcriptional regulator [Aquidulcibacter sp.]|uniref:IclR family transcriptional regulator n=1 Tax=Aquidulcibacter sp. TaxID=2052990 RepID=UPI003783BCFE
MTKKLNAQPNHSLIDGFNVLQALASIDEPIGGRKLARLLDLEPTRANRLLKTLAYMGFARQTEDRKYTTGPGMYVLAAQSLFASGFIRTALPALEELRRFNLTVALGVLWKDTVSYLYHAPPGMPSVEALGRIGIYPASKGGIGLALLAQYDDGYIDSIYGLKKVAGFENKTALKQKLTEVRDLGYVRVKVHESEEKHTLAIAVGKPAHAALGLSGWIPESNVPELLEALTNVADLLTLQSQLPLRQETSSLIQFSPRENI